MGCAFILQSAADNRRKLQKAITGSQTPMNQLLNMAFAIFNNRGRSEDEFVQNKCQPNFWPRHRGTLYSRITSSGSLQGRSLAKPDQSSWLTKTQAPINVPSIRWTATGERIISTSKGRRVHSQNLYWPKLRRTEGAQPLLWLVPNIST